MKKKTEEERLVRAAQRGNVDAYGQLFQRYQEYLYRTAFLYTKQEDQALDMVQECVLKGFLNIKKLKQPQYFKTWITRILLNTVNDAFRKEVKTADITEFELPKEEPSVSQEEKLDLYEAMETLPEVYRKVVILRFFNDLKLSEVAEILDLPQGTVTAYLSRAKKQLKEQLKEGYAHA
ncbi:MAG: sigma-70 family RNA polymerase sigma factor [Lachnospiraceae bacterium]